MILKVIKYLKKQLLFIYDKSGTMYYRSQGVNIGSNCSFIGKKINFSSEQYLVTIGNNCRISFEVCFITHDGGTHILRKKFPEICIYGPIVIGNNVFIGARSMILPNVKVGNNVIIGAGALVTKSIPDNEVWGGVPARKICTVEEYVSKNQKNFSYILNKPYKEKKRILLNRYNKQNIN